MKRYLPPVLLAACAALAPAAAAPAEGVALELNRLEPLSSGCRMHVVLRNPTDSAFARYHLDLVVFGTDGVVATRVALDASPLRARKTSVYAFDVADLQCSAFGRVLLNDIAGCAPPGGRADCTGPVSVSTRAGVDLVK